jgi:hypothetical protein
VDAGSANGDDLLGCRGVARDEVVGCQREA